MKYAIISIVVCSECPHCREVFSGCVCDLLHMKVMPLDKPLHNCPLKSKEQMKKDGLIK